MTATDFDYDGPVSDDDQPASWAEWEAEMMRLLWVRRDGLKGSALVQALAAIARIAEHQRERERPDQNIDSRQTPLLESVDALPKDVAVELVKAELERLADLRRDYMKLLRRLEANP